MTYYLRNIQGSGVALYKLRRRVCLLEIQKTGARLSIEENFKESPYEVAEAIEFFLENHSAQVEVLSGVSDKVLDKMIYLGIRCSRVSGGINCVQLTSQLNGRKL